MARKTERDQLMDDALDLVRTRIALTLRARGRRLKNAAEEDIKERFKALEAGQIIDTKALVDGLDG